MHNFTPFACLFGCMLIDLSASAILLLNGKIAGISGILAGVLKPVRGDIGRDNLRPGDRFGEKHAGRTNGARPWAEVSR